jgi:hypothetical protein
VSRRPHAGLAAVGPLGQLEDAAYRAADTIALAWTVDPRHARGKTMAIRLSDGGSNGVLYDFGMEAARAQLHPKQCWYVEIGLTPPSARECAVMLAACRRMYDSHGYDPLAALEHRFLMEGK